jgi:hypothetical protein
MNTVSVVNEEHRSFLLVRRHPLDLQPNLQRCWQTVLQIVRLEFLMRSLATLQRLHPHPHLHTHLHHYLCTHHQLMDQMRDQGLDGDQRQVGLLLHQGRRHPPEHVQTPSHRHHHLQVQQPQLVARQQLDLSEQFQRFLWILLLLSPLQGLDLW